MLAVAVLAVLAPGPAVATARLAFTPTPCFSGAINATPLTDGDLEVTGSLDCASSDPSAAFGIAHYYGRAGDPTFWTDVIFDSTLRPYANEAPSTFSVRNEVESEEFGLCVVTDYDVRVACVRVARQKNVSLYAVTPLATNDPMVARPVRAIIFDMTGRAPSCGGCW